MDDSGAAAAFMQIIDILGDQRQVMDVRQIGQRAMRSVRLCCRSFFAARIIELLDQSGVAIKGLWCGHILDPMVFP